MLSNNKENYNVTSCSLRYVQMTNTSYLLDVPALIKVKDGTMKNTRSAVVLGQWHMLESNSISPILILVTKKE